MNVENPYDPVQTRVLPGARRSDRPFYIYGMAVVLLLWAGIYIYLQSQNEVPAERQELQTSGSPQVIDLVTIVALFALSVVVVNSCLWAALKLLRH